MKIIVLITFLVSLLISPSWSETLTFYDITRRDGLIYKKFSNTPFSGTLKGKWNMKVRKGKPIGEVLIYTENGQLETKGFFNKKGQPEGEQRLYYETGQIKSLKFYKNGKEDGVFIDYHKNGKIRDKTPYIDGKVEGISRSFDESGNLRNEIPYKNGQMNGNWKSYNLLDKYRDKVSIVTPYKDGKKHGTQKWFWWDRWNSEYIIYLRSVYNMDILVSEQKFDVPRRVYADNMGIPLWKLEALDR